MCNEYAQRKRAEAIAAKLETQLRDRAGNQLPLPGIYPNRAAPIIRLIDGEYELSMATWGMPTPKEHLVTKTGRQMAHDPGLTNIRHPNSSDHWQPWLGIENRCLMPFTSFAENAPVTYTPTWFAIDESRPQLFFAGIWDHHARQVRAKDPEITHNDYCAFLTTKPNAEVKPIHPKAMPVILTTVEECETWLTAPWEIAKGLQRSLPDGTLKIVHTGKGDPEEMA